MIQQSKVVSLTLFNPPSDPYGTGGVPLIYLAYHWVILGFVGKYDTPKSIGEG
jgi:hypothetical protein